MRIILSPAKKMRTEDSLPWQSLPAYINRTERILEVLQGMDGDVLKRLWKCNDQIAKLNVERLSRMELGQNLTPAILAYEGIAYQHMAPGVFTDQELRYVQEHLRILSGFYGILRPFDGVTPYRLEMQAKLVVDGKKDLYAFWGDSLARDLEKETGCIVNLASKEYSVCISKYLPPDVRFITCVFGEEKDGKIVEKGTMCKMARGEMVRCMAQHQITNPEDIRAFSMLDFRYAPEYSDDSTCVFLRQHQKNGSGKW